jgi:hypothetical protein
MVDLSKLKIPARKLISQLMAKGIKLYEWTEYVARAVTNLNVTEQDIRLSAREIIAAIETIMALDHHHKR